MLAAVATHTLVKHCRSIVSILFFKENNFIGLLIWKKKKGVFKLMIISL